MILFDKINLYNFYLYIYRDSNDEPRSSNSQEVTQASIEGKLKEKLESMGVAFLCIGLSQNTFYFLQYLSEQFLFEIK